jgi:hypothetical protein
MNPIYMRGWRAGRGDAIAKRPRPERFSSVDLWWDGYYDGYDQNA